MKKRSSFLAIGIAALACASNLYAQNLPGVIGVDAVLLPPVPTSADNLRLTLPARSCLGPFPYIGQTYVHSMSQNNIVILRGPVNVPPVVPSACSASVQREEFDLGRLPAGNYTLTVTEVLQGGALGTNLFTNASFTVVDARSTKAAPYVRLDYSGHWWDPNDSGWGLFIWQDARSSTDSLLAAWFTYTPDGKPMWYVFQPRWQTATSTTTADMAQASRPPGMTSPPPTTTSTSRAGTASLDFTNFGTADEGKITYSFDSVTGSTTLTRTIKRFKP